MRKHFFIMVFGDVNFCAIPVHHGIAALTHEVRKPKDITEKSDFGDDICHV
jgi:hypothetical protein